MRIATRVGGAVLAAVPLAIAANVATNDSWLGFRDGYISPYHHATLFPHRVFCWFSVAIACWLLYLGWRGRDFVRRAAIIMVLYGLACIVTFYVVDDWYLKQQLDLDDGHGG
jgi:hypothetical protein